MGCGYGFSVFTLLFMLHCVSVKNSMKIFEKLHRGRSLGSIFIEHTWDKADFLHLYVFNGYVFEFLAPKSSLVQVIITLFMNIIVTLKKETSQTKFARKNLYRCNFASGPDGGHATIRLFSN